VEEFLNKEGLEQTLAGLWGKGAAAIADISLTPGPPGPKGDKGDTGVAGAQGPQGIQGAAGAKGAAGATGAQGVKGDKGDAGAQGATGPTGAQGVKGDKGDTGAQGPAGIPVAYLKSAAVTSGTTESTLTVTSDASASYTAYTPRRTAAGEFTMAKLIVASIQLTGA
jgi:hypothetical protein